MKSSQLSTNEYADFYSNYIKYTQNLSLIEGLLDGQAYVSQYFRAIPENKLTYSYAEGKWTPKDILQHLIDVERVFSYRALHFARLDANMLAGFDENYYAEIALGNNRTLDSLLSEYELLRASTMAMFQSFDEDVLRRIGNANGSKMSVRAAGFVLIGHEKHHCNVITERYL
ncbi:DinB family protein [Corallibacter vietnamensis]|uniref:DinB family protein n=1 Tax=Corallibacter vietnamensis TaxID=904130 RepID=A0ABP7H8F1_9FLAO